MFSTTSFKKHWSVQPMPSNDSREPPTYDGQVDTNYMKPILTERIYDLCNVYFIEDTLKCPSTWWQPEKANLWWTSRPLLHEIVTLNLKLLTNMIYNYFIHWCRNNYKKNHLLSSHRKCLLTSSIPPQCLKEDWTNYYTYQTFMLKAPFEK